MLAIPNARLPKRFLKFNLRQLLILVALLGVLLAIMMPRIRRARHLSQLHADARRMQAAALRELVAAVKANDVAQARRALEAGATANALANEPTQMSLLCSSIAKGRIVCLAMSIPNAGRNRRIEATRGHLARTLHGGFAATHAAPVLRERTNNPRRGAVTLLPNCGPTLMMFADGIPHHQLALTSFAARR